MCRSFSIICGAWATIWIRSTGVLDVPQLRKDMADIRAAVKAVQDAYTMKNS